MGEMHTIELLKNIREYVYDYYDKCSKNGIQNLDIDDIMSCIENLEKVLDNHEARLIMMEKVMQRVKEVYGNVNIDNS